MTEALLSKPARDLSPQNGFDLLMHHAEQGDIELVVKPKENERGQITTHRVGENIEIVSEMAGVTYAHINGGAHRLRPKAEFAILLYRLAVWLSEKCAVKKIYYGGIGAGSGKNAIDCHSDGRCIDFYKAETASGRVFDVDKDWWQQPVMLKTEAKAHAVAGNDRWADDTKTYFRLAASVQPLASQPGALFGHVYEFAMNEAAITTNDISAAAFRRGDPLKAGRIFHPDHPVPGSFGKNAIAGRRNHFQHMHFGVGKDIG